MTQTPTSRGNAIATILRLLENDGPAQPARAARKRHRAAMTSISVRIRGTTWLALGECRTYVCHQTM